MEFSHVHNMLILIQRRFNLTNAESDGLSSGHSMFLDTIIYYSNNLPHIHYAWKISILPEQYVFMLEQTTPPANLKVDKMIYVYHT